MAIATIPHARCLNNSRVKLTGLLSVQGYLSPEITLITGEQYSFVSVRCVNYYIPEVVPFYYKSINHITQSTNHITQSINHITQSTNLSTVSPNQRIYQPIGQSQSNTHTHNNNRVTFFLMAAILVYDTAAC
jgi:hypothetical protein